MRNNTSKSFDRSHNEATKKHNTSSTSRQSFKQINKSGQRLKEKVLVLEAIHKHQPVTSRMLSELIGKERSNITRTLFDLEHDDCPTIKVAFEARCPVTKKIVKHYTVIDWKQEN